MKVNIIAMTVLTGISVSSRAGEPAYQKDKQGLLVPRMSYGRFLERSFTFVLHDLDNGWASGNA